MRRALLLIVMITLFPGKVTTAQTVLTYGDLAARLYDLERLATPPLPGERSGNFSSWDRGAKYNAQTEQYEGWHANADGGGFIRPEGTGIVAAEIEGPGVIWRVWSALANEGHVKLFIDGHETPALDIPFGEFFNNQNGPFAYPELVLTLSRGRNNFVPIAFQSSCKIVLEKNWGAYYQITYTQLPEGTTVPSFRGEFNEDEQAALRKANDVFAARGTDPKPPAADRQTVTETVTIEPGESLDVCRLTGRRAITQIHVVPDADDDDPIRTLRELTLSVTWDDDRQPAVWTPLGDFFGTAPGINRFKSIPTGMTEHGFYAYWYMPFSKSACMTIANDGAKPRTLGVKVVHQPVATDELLLHFHAKWHRDAYVGVDEQSFTHGDRWPDWPLLVTEGRGRFVGVNLHVWNPNPFGRVTKVLDIDAKQFSPRILGTMQTAAKSWWWGEGDEKFLVDGEKMPSTFGTGSEDYFGYAWAAHNPVEFESALQNQPLNKNDSLGHVSNNRFQLADNVPFQTRFEAVIEKYHPNNWPLLYACTAYWYQAAGEADWYRPVPVAQRVDYYVEPTREAPVPADGIYEGERHLLFDPPARAQGMAPFGGGWSGGQQLLWHGSIGDEASVTFEVGQQYEGPMTARFTLAPDYGAFDVLLDGKVLKKGIDLYDPKVVLGPKQELGTVELSPGTHKLTFRLTGGNEQARRFQDKFFMLGLDYVALLPAQ
ncbi:MAG TPA: glycoside hydrolase family 172 protein [Thermoguttaceae bacterium]|nr:glycoside hydrolase family 172 protein [Thermoguttaceae bacterium]